jgi:hypothetical protein
VLIAGARLRRRQMSPLDLLQTTTNAVVAMRRGGTERMIELGAQALAGRDHEELLETAEHEFATVLAPRMFSEARALVAGAPTVRTISGALAAGRSVAVAVPEHPPGFVDVAGLPPARCAAPPRPTYQSYPSRSATPTTSSAGAESSCARA